MGNSCSGQTGNHTRVHIGGHRDPKVFKTWEDVTVTDVPIVYPRTDAALKAIISKARKDRSKVKVMGATHSAAGLVTNGKDDEGNATKRQVVVSLEKHTPSTEGWKTISLNTDTSTVRIPAGRTFLDLYQVIRPENYFLPSQTAGWFFTIAGAICNCVHGGVFGADMLNRYVTRMLVMNGKGEIVEITDEDDLTYYRCSFGMLGVVLAVEFQVVRRETFKITSSHTIMHWSEHNFNQLIEDVKDRSIYGEFFMDCMHPDTVSIAAVEFSKQGVRIKNRRKFEREYIKLQNHWDDKVKMVTWGDPTLDFINEGLANEHMWHMTNTADSVKLLVSSTINATQVLAWEDFHSTNDGYWVRQATGAAIMAYFIPSDQAFKALNIYRTIFRECLHNTEDEDVFKINQPCEFRFVTIQKGGGPKLFHIPEGEYCVVEVLSFTGFTKSRVYDALHQVEQAWLDMGAVPHVGKLFGFHKGRDGETLPFARRAFHNDRLATAADRQEFETRRAACDPDGIFLTPNSSWFL